MRVMVLEVATLQTKMGKDYLSMKVRTIDKQEMAAKIWSFVDGITAGMVVTGDHKMDSYQGNPHIIFNSLGPDVNQSTAEFEKSSTRDIGLMWIELNNIVEDMVNPVARIIAKELLFDPKIEEAIKRAPAAKGVHNAWFGGLLEHMLSLCSLAKSVVPHYNNQYNANVDIDKVIFGCLVHDLGKTIEYNYKTASFDIAPEGLLVNHIVLGPAWIYNAAKQSPELAEFECQDEVYQLMHICAAHHGKTEWGSPVAPTTLEAILVHHIDNLDAKMMHAIELTKGKEGPVKGFSERSWFEKVSYKIQKIFKLTEDNEKGF